MFVVFQYKKLKIIISMNIYSVLSIRFLSKQVHYYINNQPVMFTIVFFLTVFILLSHKYFESRKNFAN